MKTLPWTASSPDRLSGHRARLLAAALLRALSDALDRLARRLAATPRQGTHQLPTLQTLEFHAEAGAPEGALYVNGKLFGHLPGVTRL